MRRTDTEVLIKQAELGRLADVRIFLVEDTAAAAMTMKALLTMESAQVTTAGNGVEALQCLQDSAFDVVLSDIGMEVMDGHELARAVRKHPRWSTLPMLAMSGFTRDEDVNRVRSDGFDGHLSKPASLDQIVKAIRQLGLKTTGRIPSD